MNKYNCSKLKHVSLKIIILFILTLTAVGFKFLNPNIQWPPKSPLTSLNIKKPILEESISMRILGIIWPPKSPLTSLNIKNPFLEERVPMRMLGIILASVYLTLMITFILLYRLDFRRILILVDLLVCSLISYSILIIVFRSIKLYFAIPRPNFLAVCIPDSLGFCDISTPQRIKKVIYGFTSFPSCHSATITYFGVLLIIVMITSPIANAIRTSRGYMFYIIYCMVLIIINLLSIVFVCLSRIWDFYHRKIDIIYGVLLGLIFVGIMIPIKNSVFRNFK